MESVDPPPDSKRRLMVRVRAERSAAAEVMPVPRRRARSGPGPRIATLIVVAASIAAGMTAACWRGEPARLEALLAHPATPRLEFRSGERSVGHAVFDRERGAALIYVQGLGSPRPGKTFVLWYMPLDGGPPVNAGALAAAPAGEPALVAESAPRVEDLQGLAISEESDPNVEQPTAVVAAALKQ